MPPGFCRWNLSMTNLLHSKYRSTASRECHLAWFLAHFLLAATINNHLNTREPGGWSHSTRPLRWQPYNWCSKFFLCCVFLQKDKGFVCHRQHEHSVLELQFRRISKNCPERRFGQTWYPEDTWINLESTDRYPGNTCPRSTTAHFCQDKEGSTSWCCSYIRPLGSVQPCYNKWKAASTNFVERTSRVGWTFCRYSSSPMACNSR